MALKLNYDRLLDNLVEKYGWATVTSDLAYLMSYTKFLEGSKSSSQQQVMYKQDQIFARKAILRILNTYGAANGKEINTKNFSILMNIAELVWERLQNT